MPIKVKYECFLCNSIKFIEFNKKEDIEDCNTDYCEECKDNSEFYPIEIVKEVK